MTPEDANPENNAGPDGVNPGLKSGLKSGAADPGVTAPEAPAGPAPRANRRVTPERRMLESLVCPVTQGRLDYDREAQELISRPARLAFPIREGIPILLVSEARRLDP